MTHLIFKASYPWLLLIIIPALALTLIPYFRLAKRYRRTRNRICSMVLHMLIMIMSISLLAGVTLEYDVPNKDNEIVLLVDMSDSNQSRQSQKDDFVKEVINRSTQLYKVGIIKFGFDAKIVSPLDNASGKFAAYQTETEIDTSASNIANAINLAKGMFTNPKAGKMVIITDAMETDGSAFSAVKAVAAMGLKVDVAYYNNQMPDHEVQIVNVEFPDTKIALGTEFDVNVAYKSTVAGKFTIKITDTNREGVQTVTEVRDVTLVAGNEEIISIKMAYELNGLHEFRFEIIADGEGANDSEIRNNCYVSFINHEVYDKTLILYSGAESATEGTDMRALLDVEDGKVDIMQIGSKAENHDEVPYTVDQLRAYDMVILVNVSNADLKAVAEAKGADNLEQFALNLKEYVSVYGGGLLTVGGNEGTEVDNLGNPIAHAYNREDMYESVYQDILPVEVVEYTPPLAVVIIIDRSGSMSGAAIDAAKEGSRSIVEIMHQRDYVGIMALSDSSTEILPLTPRVRKDEILEAIDSIQSGGGTSYTPTLRRAGNSLMACEVERRHIVLVSDGAPSDKLDEYGAAIDYNFKRGITTTIVNIGDGSHADMEEAARRGGGRHIVADAGSIGSLPDKMRDDVASPSVMQVSYEDFTPTIGDRKISSLFAGIEVGKFEVLHGYYGTLIKTNESAIVPLKGEFVPIYAQWKQGLGFVGSLMVNVGAGSWSEDFFADAAGRTFINNVFNTLCPAENIRVKDFTVKVQEDNYSTQVSIVQIDNQKFESAAEVKVTIASPSESGMQFASEQSQSLPADTKLLKFDFVLKQSGLHRIKVELFDANGGVIVSNERYLTYKAFSYSEEYDVFRSEEDAKALATYISDFTGGGVIKDSEEVFRDFVKYNHRKFDPRKLFMIMSLILFLLDIAVRKFKFKWIHEIIRDRKQEI